nr:hypothetical protein CFP56_26220 [Quercus suber]
MQRLFWGQCALGFVLDYRKFSVAYLQHLIRSWRLRGEVTVVGRDSFFYLIHFESLEDLEHMCSEGPWSIDGAFLDPELAERMGHMIGYVEKIDWEDRLPRNIRFMRIKVYERVHKLCTKCGLIGHARSQCSESMDEVERMLIRQRHRIQRLFQVPFVYDALEPQFYNELRAYFNKRRNRTTRARFGFMESEFPVDDHPPSASFNPEPPNFPASTPNQNTSVSPTSHPHMILILPVQHDNEHATLNSAILSLSLNRGSVPSTPVNSPRSSPDVLHPPNFKPKHTCNTSSEPMPFSKRTHYLATRAGGSGK